VAAPRGGRGLTGGDINPVVEAPPATRGHHSMTISSPFAGFSL
jgi:hypothetical protein